MQVHKVSYLCKYLDCKSSENNVQTINSEVYKGNPTNGDAFKVCITWLSNRFSPAACETLRFTIKSGNAIMPDYGDTIQGVRVPRWKGVGRVLHKTRICKRCVHISNQSSASVKIKTT